MTETINFTDHIRTVEDFPIAGVPFYDLAPLLGNGAVFGALIDELAAPLEGRVDKFVGFDARGFIFGGALAARLGAGLSLLRKPGKLPGEVTGLDYQLEYGSNRLEIQTDSLRFGDRVVLIDDVIATGGTALAGIELVRKLGADIVEFTSVLSIAGLGGVQRIEDADVPVRSIIEV